MSKIGRHWSRMVACLAVAGCAGQDARLPRLASNPAPAAYRLGPGDELRISVLGMDGMNNSYIVGDTGMIALPIVDTVPARDKTVREVEAEIASRLAERRIVIAPKVSAQVQTYRPFFILGEVQKAGSYPYVPGMSVLTAASLAGGYTFRADTKTVAITRGSQKWLASSDTPVLPGDIIQIRESWF